MNHKLPFFSIFITVAFAILCSCKSGRGDESQYEVINGCKKMVSHKALDANNAENWTEWRKVYFQNANETCDFSSFVIYYKKYKNSKLMEQTQFYSACDDCEEKPCGTWTYYDFFGTEVKKVEHEDCTMNRFR